MKNIAETREAYLVSAIHEFSTDFVAAGAPLPKVRVSCGWPSSGGRKSKGRALGECWDKSASTDDVAQIFISPAMMELVDLPEVKGMGVLPTLVHELVHGAIGNDKGHGKEFKKVATALGLEGKMTSTHAGEKLSARCMEVAKILGPYPHAEIKAEEGKGGPVGKKKQSTRMIKCECGVCGYAVRVSRKWLLEGAPICPKHAAMSFDETALDDYDDGDGEDND